MGRLPALAALLLAPALCAFSARATAQGVVLSEIMAVNERALADEDGDFPDWIELYNSGSQDESLSGWYLTDDPTRKTKWKFPDVSIGPGRFLIVFASEKDRTTPGKPLHTSFHLEPEGEYLALVRPDGATVASEVTPKYPRQIADVSYGVPMESTVGSLVPAGVPVKVLVPQDDALGRDWVQPDFDDSTWTAGTTGVGFDRKTSPTYTDLIGLNVETQMYKIRNSIYIRVPFNVPDLASIGVAILRMRYEDGFVAYLNGIEVARKNAPTTTLKFDSKAPSRRPEADAVKYEDYPLTNYASAFRTGTNVLAIHGLNDSSTTTSADFLCFPEIETRKVTAIHADNKVFFEQGSPGLPNAPSGVPGISPDPEFSISSGVFANPFTVELQSSDPQATIRYTTDRTDPKETSTAYTGPIQIDVTTAIRARTYSPSLLPGELVENTYVILGTTAASFSSNLPILIIETFSKPIPEDPFLSSRINLLENPLGRTNITDTPIVSTRAGVKKRGSSSLGFPKNNFALELWDDRGGEKEFEMLDMAPESDWILYGPYTDKTLMRDYLTYDWSNQMGRWAVKCRFIEVFLNQSGTKIDAADYWGVYVFMEKIKRDDNRVDIKKLYASQKEAPEITGGYIMKNDRLDPGDSGMLTKRGLRLAWVYPKEREATLEQRNYLKGFLDEFETALYGNSFADPNVGYAKYIDIGSFIDHHILTELVKNIDGYRLSTFMFKDREGKLNMGPPWDYNLTLGNANYLAGWDPTGWYYTQVGSYQEYPWFPRLHQDPNYLAQYRTRWFELRQNVIVADKMLQQIDSLATFLDEAQKRNFTKWKILGTYVWPNQFIGNTYAEEINFMKDWLTKRIAWMDGQFVPVPVFSKNGGLIEPGFQLEITAPAGSVYYTLNAGDPMDPSGGVAAEAQPYDQPIVLNANTRVRARIRVGELWGALKEVTFVTKLPPIVISEIMYNPAPPTEGNYRAADYKYLELYNNGTETYDLTGARFTKAIVFDFTESAVTSLAPGEYVVVVKNEAAFKSRYPDATIRIAGQWTQDLSDRGEPIAIKGNLDETIMDFAYADVWYPETDGKGPSIVLIDPQTPPDALGDKTLWRPSSSPNGTPGKPDSAPVGGLQRIGDISQDGTLNITDAVALLRFLFQGLLPALPCDGGTVQDPGNRMLADLDNDGTVNLTDAVFILRFLFQEGAPPALGTSCVRMPGCADVCTP